MPIARFGFDESGEFVDDAFYQLYWDEVWNEIDWRGAIDVGPNDILSEPRQLTCDRSLVVAHMFHREQRNEYNCTVSKTHRTNIHVESAVVELRGNLFGDFFPSTDQSTIVSGRCASMISQSDLKGPSFTSVAIRSSETPYPSCKQGLRLVQRPPNDPLRLHTIWPSSANRCYLCGFEPLCCPKCGYCIRDCPRCEGDIFADESEHRGEGDRRILIKRFPRLGSIVEVARWDGSDFVGNLSHHHIVTKRTVDFLLARDVWPFWAKSLRANVKGISKRKMAQLDRAKQPIQ